MNVLCINDNWVPDPESSNMPCPAIGDRDIVTDTVDVYGVTFYKLQRFGYMRGFIASHFVDIDETAEPEQVTEEVTLLQTA